MSRSVRSLKASPFQNITIPKKITNNNFAILTNSNLVFPIRVTEVGGDISDILNSDWLFSIETTFL